MLSDQSKTSWNPLRPPKETWVAFDESCCPWNAIRSVPLHEPSQFTEPCIVTLTPCGSQPLVCMRR